ncbi:hypothetical protein LTR53_001321 [Teratosphaeriaceae sp. CCFEE 6253]|nr:hypothetical protein LTR53_001321 [Teratosphaeriaceae sp. CCFEE 6253]
MGLIQLSLLALAILAAHGNGAAIPEAAVPSPVVAPGPSAAIAAASTTYTGVSKADFLMLAVKDFGTKIPLDMYPGNRTLLLHSARQNQDVLSVLSRRCCALAD